MTDEDGHTPLVVSVVIDECPDITQLLLNHRDIDSFSLQQVVDAVKPQHVTRETLRDYNQAKLFEAYCIAKEEEERNKAKEISTLLGRYCTDENLELPEVMETLIIEFTLPKATTGSTFSSKLLMQLNRHNLIDYARMKLWIDNFSIIHDDLRISLDYIATQGKIVASAISHASYEKQKLTHVLLNSGILHRKNIFINRNRNLKLSDEAEEAVNAGDDVAKKMRHSLQLAKIM